MKPLRKILVNLEEEHGNDQALEKASWLAERTGAAVELFCCCFNLTLRNAWLFDHEAGLHAQHAYLRHIEARLDTIAETLVGRGFEVGVDVAWERHHAEGVIRKAIRYEPDLVIHQVGRHSRLGHYLLAHHDWQLLRDCGFPLLLVKAHRWHEQPRIAACVDPFHDGEAPGELDRELLKHAAWLRELTDGRLHAVHSYHTLPQSAIFDEHVVTDFEALKQKVTQQHTEALNRLLGPVLDPEGEQVHLLKGESHQTLPRFAEEHGIDVMVMGSVARGFVDRLLLGSTVERVLDEIACDVLVVKPPGFVSPVKG
ncbi:hypothetical protein GCM10011348_18190 [Marinobacterium nitratireducens]|uniref:UspA domain-containing protein n=1 Tax=Marinobacterium nitratireducens TaxID=518897 RepID=A0A917ZCC8_9GAMM|nr:universal stress protein [Marinobacterium nitratireducens]GGO80765.1 hypothetical protein GCM10011348_18190 [Marinobacterium nitratireducens]